MKIIFLDIDGVLNCQNSKSKMTDEFGHTYIGIDSDKMRRLKAIVERTGADIVLTSTWRKYLYKDDSTGKYMRNKFRKHELRIYSSAVYHKYNRGAGIHSWLNAHKDDVVEWLVLDDEWFTDYDKEIGKHLILTEFYSDDGGLQDKHIETACDILNGKLQEADNKISILSDEFTHVGLE